LAFTQRERLDVGAQGGACLMYGCSMRRIDDPLLQLLQGLEHRFVKAWLFLVESASCLSPVLSPLASLLGAPALAEAA